MAVLLFLRQLRHNDPSNQSPEAFRPTDCLTHSNFRNCGKRQTYDPKLTE